MRAFNVRRKKSDTQEQRKKMELLKSESDSRVFNPWEQQFIKMNHSKNYCELPKRDQLVMDRLFDWWLGAQKENLLKNNETIN